MLTYPQSSFARMLGLCVAAGGLAIGVVFAMADKGTPNAPAGTNPAEKNPAVPDRQVSNKTSAQAANPANGKALATFAGGCFWCTEAVFQQLKGVESVVSGYIGGAKPNPTYEQVCSGASGHAEAIQITFDPSVISYAELLEVFWNTHDPTTPNRQGNDRGTQYRSAVFYHDDEQRNTAQQYRRQLDKAGVFGAPIVTEITAAGTFYPAEKYHQNYFNDNGEQGYCAVIIRPKVEKFRRQFADKLK